jgi:hopanoid biosynthesis associated RND transporter like protein HpnN
MVKSIITRIVELCNRHPWPVIGLGLLLATASVIYTVRHFTITTDIEQLISSDLPWHKRQLEFSKAFRERDILVVVQAPTPELVEQAADALGQRLSMGADHIDSVQELGAGRFFERNGLLYLPTEEVARTIDGLVKADPLLGTLAEDPSLRGIMSALSSSLLGLKSGQLQIDGLAWPLTLAADTVDDVLAGRPASFSWRVLVQGRPAEPSDLRRLIQVQPVLDFAELQPGKAATNAIRQAAADLQLASKFQASVRLTGSIPIADDEFATLRDGAFLNTTLTVVTVLIILWLALRSFRIILAVALTLFIGLPITAALGLMVVGAFNLMSIAFAVLFIGLGVDFAIQFSVRYRSERHDIDDLAAAMRSTADKVGVPLALAAVATAIGFFSFLPTAYRGLSDLGEIAGTGMLIAFATSITVLPALLAILRPPGEPHPLGFAALAPIDHFTERHRVPIIVITLAVVAAGLPLLLRLPFDFNPVNLRNPHSESVATFLELQKDPQTGANASEILAPTLDDANAIAARLAKLPEVARTITISNFVPEDQDRKLQLIAKAANALDMTLNPQSMDPPPSDEENASALSDTAADLSDAAGTLPGPGADAARRLSGLLSRLAASDHELRDKAEAAVVPPLKVALDTLRKALHPEHVTVQTLPQDLARNWLTVDGRARVQVLPKGDPNDTANLRSFATAVLAAEPNATGAAVSYLESGRTVVRAFIEAGAGALMSVAVLLWIALRRFGDVLLTLVPLLVAGVVTLELCVILGLPLNFANIIALPLLLGVGVAFKIYYIMAWRAGKTALLQSTLTRAVTFSAMTTATAFGSLWLSNHPGTSSMGKMMALALVCTMAAAVLFQPILMGPPRQKAGDKL